MILSPWQPPVVKVVMTNLLANNVQCMKQGIQQHMLMAVLQTSILNGVVHHTDGFVDPSWSKIGLAAVTDRGMHTRNDGDPAHS